MKKDTTQTPLDFSKPGTITSQLRSLCAQREKQLVHKQIPRQGPNGHDRHRAINQIRNRLNFYINKGGHTVELNHVIVLWDAIESLIPGKDSAFQELRHRVATMLDYARRYHQVPAEYVPQAARNFKPELYA